MIYILIIALIFWGEYVLKNYIEKNKREGQHKKAFGGMILVTKYHNKGAFLEAGKKYSFLVRMIALMFTIGVTIVFLLTLGTKGNHVLKTGLALLLGGAFSNTYDRLKRKYVVDYFRINVPFEPLRRVIFNLSDFCIIIGVVVTALKW